MEVETGVPEELAIDDKVVTSGADVGVRLREELEEVEAGALGELEESDVEEIDGQKETTS